MLYSDLLLNNSLFLYNSLFFTAACSLQKISYFTVTCFAADHTLYQFLLPTFFQERMRT